MLLSLDERPNSLAFEANGNSGDLPPDLTDTDTDSSVPVHPLGIKPLGNRYFWDGATARDAIGVLQVLPDEMLVQLLEFLDQRTLRLLGYTCKFLFAHCISEELWKALFLESDFKQRHTVTWLGIWRSTLLQLPADRSAAAHVNCDTVFSDVLHRPFVCSHLPLGKYTNIPKCNEMARFDDLSYDEFAAQWSSTPFILTQSIRPWPVCKDWNLDTLLEKYADVPFRAEAVDWTFSTYHKYMFDNQDESPVYLFDKAFAEKMDLQVGKDVPGAAYWKPAVFGPDLFELLGPERPAHRWLICGPRGSGSTFHKDPNATSAWNAVLQGTKYWIMFPPATQVPGVYVSRDASEVTSPLSIAEWLLEFHAAARALPSCMEGLCGPGEIVHVPSGWWHLVLNLDAGVALTQNFVPRDHLADVLAFLRDRPEQVTGFRRDVEDPHGLFVERLREKYPELLEEAREKLARRDALKKRRWEDAVGAQGNGDGSDSPQKKSTGFSFGFGFVEDEEEEEQEEETL